MRHRPETGSGKPAPKPNVIDQLLDEKGPLSEDEQARVIKEFELMHIQQSRQHRHVFGFGALGMATFFAWSAHEHHLHPYGQRYTAAFQTVTPDPLTVTGMLLLQSLALAACGLALLSGVPRRNSGSRACLPTGRLPRLALSLGVGMGLVGAVFWGRAMYDMIHKYGTKLGARWSLLWLPLGPLVFCALCWYVVVTLDTSGQQVLRMRRLKYTFKKV